MTVDDLLVSFRAGLLGALPAVERAGIAWQRPDAYDAWDDLAAALYRALLVEPLRAALPAAERERFALPDFDMLLPTYAGLSVIEVLPRPADGASRVFHAFGTRETPLDTVEWRQVRADGSPESDALDEVPFSGAHFSLRRSWDMADDTGGR